MLLLLAPAVGMSRRLHRESTAARPYVYGMVHVGALPGTPRSVKSVPTLIKEAVEEANALVGAGVVGRCGGRATDGVQDGVILENMAGGGGFRVG